MDATEMFLVRHQRTHAHLERLTGGLGEERIRERAHPMVNPLAWLLWHVARTEDSAVNLLVFDGTEALDDEWCGRLNTPQRDAGTGMTMNEVVELSTQVDLPSLTAHSTAVGRRTVDRGGSQRHGISTRS
jgi:hypothetical protein